VNQLLNWLVSRSTHSHLTDLADREEKDEITEVSGQYYLHVDLG
jgi:hypothetical protein